MIIKENKEYLNNIIDPKLVFFKPEIANYEDLFKLVSAHLLNCSIVKEGFVESIILRESTHPTAIPSELIDFAIPHTSPEFVTENKICVILLENPISFSSMVDKEVKIDVEVVFLILIKEGSKHLKALSMIMDLVRNKEYVSKIKNSTSKSELKEIVHSYNRTLNYIKNL